jgi:hypothetical protein
MECNDNYLILIMVSKQDLISTKFARVLDWILGLMLIALGVLRFILDFFSMSNPVDYILSVYYM